MSNAARVISDLSVVRAQRTFVRTSNLVKTYKLGESLVSALRGVTMELCHGDIVALCGSSGSGKSTLLNLLGCLDTPTSGEIFIGGESVSKMSEKALDNFRATRLGFIFQTFNLLPVLSAVENVEYPLMKTKLSRTARREQAMHTLEMVGLAQFAKHRPCELSGGQRQRVAIARAIVHRPELIIADEPTANLDNKTSEEILDLICNLNRQLNVTVVIATHDQRVVARADRSVQISDGMVA